MFIGQFQHTIDAKGRVSIPGDFRETLNALNGTDGEMLVVSRDDDDQCLVAYSLNEFRQWVEKAKKLPTMNPEVKDYLRLRFSSAVKCPLDRQGRILIPPTLRAHAGLNRNAMLIGIESKIEIWDLQRWRTTETLISGRANRIAETVAGFGIM